MKISGTGPVIVVDDDVDALRIARAVFDMSAVKNKLVLLNNGLELLEYLDHVSEGSKPMPSLVLLDINMQVPNGHETLRAIRSRTPFREAPCIVMFTASNNSEDIETALAEGANGYQVKPFGLEEFISFVDSLV